MGCVLMLLTVLRIVDDADGSAGDGDDDDDAGACVVRCVRGDVHGSAARQGHVSLKGREERDNDEKQGMEL